MERHRRPPIAGCSRLRQAQQGGDDVSGLIDVRDCLVCNRLELFQRPLLIAAALESEPRPRKWCPQIMGDVVTYPRERMDHRFHFIEQAIDDDREPRKRIVDVAVWEPLAQMPAMMRWTR